MHKRMSALCQKRTFVGDESASALQPLRLLGKRSGARQNDPYFGEFTRLSLDLY